MKKYLVNGMLIVLSAAVLVNLVFMYREFTDNVSAISDYDYRIAIFGNDGIYPEEVVTFAQNLDKNLPKVTIENPPIYFDAEGYNVMCVALDDDTFEKCYKMPCYLRSIQQECGIWTILMLWWGILKLKFWE